MPERVKEFLMKTGLTQAQAGDAIGVSGAQISRWMLGQNAMPRTVKLAFQSVFNVREQWWDDGGEMLLDDMGKLSPQEVRLVELFRQGDMQARDEILQQAEFQLGRALRRKDKTKEIT